MRAQTAASSATVLTLSLGNAIAIGDPALLSSNIAVIRNALQLSLSTASLVTAAAFLRCSSRPIPHSPSCHRSSAVC